MRRRKPHRRCRRPRPRAAGFTVMEMLVIIAVIGIVALMFVNVLSTLPSRLALRDGVEQARFVIQKARIEAIQRGVRTVVEINTATGEMRAYADINGNVAGSDLIYDPAAALEGTRKTDYEVAYFRLERTSLGAPASAPVAEDRLALKGLTVTPNASAPWATQVLVFTPSGAPVADGAFRLVDGRGRNYMEIAVAPFTGNIDVGKYLEPGDPPGGGQAGFYPEGQEGTGEALWVWY